MKALGYPVRVLSCFLLLFATWNPLGYSYLAWIGEDDGALLSAKVMVGVLLALCHIIYARITWVAMGAPGLATALAIMLSGFLMLRHLGVLDPNQPFWSAYLGLTLVSVVLSIGLCWAHFKRRLVGQSQVIKAPP